MRTASVSIWVLSNEPGSDPSYMHQDGRGHFKHFDLLLASC